MRVRFAGVGAIGNPIASHVLDSGKFDDDYVYDLSKSAVAKMVENPATVECCREFV